MYDAALIWDWFGFAVRWLHVIAAIVWIGTSFYFIALDLGLRRTPGLPHGVHGEEWQVHGGGFYRIQKYLVAPEALPEHLTWFKWESYATWLSGAALLAIVYWVDAELFLIDPAKMDLAVWEAIAISAGSLAIGWLIYDRLCKSRLGERPTLLMVLLFAVLVAMAWGYAQTFTGRAALLHLGAFTATVMTANVFLVIIPNQRIVVADLKAGRAPDPKYGKAAGLRSTHNNYLTLPILFLMLSVHHPPAFATEYNWLIASLVFLMGVTVRHYFNTVHARAGHPVWTWFATALLFVVVVWLSSVPVFRGPSDAEAASTPARERFALTEGFQDVHDAVLGRCSMCHAREPLWDGIRWAPGGMLLESEGDIIANARQIYVWSGLTHAMPPANVSFMEQEERDLIVAWYRKATGAAATGR